YALCALNPKGNPNVFYRPETSVCILVAAIWELYMKEIIQFEEDMKISVKKELGIENTHLLPIYDFIKDSKPQTTKKIIESFYLSLGNRKLKPLINSLLLSLEQNECIEKLSSTTVF